MKIRYDYFNPLKLFSNKRLEEFLKEWSTIKERMIAENKAQNNVFSDDFVA